MVYLKRKEVISPSKMSALWLSFTLLDVDLHKTALLNILKQFAEIGHKPYLIAIRSRNAYRVEDPKIGIIPVALRYVPGVSIIMFTVVLAIFLPVIIVSLKIKYILFEPQILILSFFPMFPNKLFFFHFYNPLSTKKLSIISNI